jgi:hemerythrin-like domain-containing protein
MNNEGTLQRSPALQPLSAEHRDGLLFIWKLRQGLSNHTGNEKLRDFVSWYWKNHIKAHFYQEEKILTPYIDPANHLAIKMKEDHDNIRDMVLAIDREGDRYNFFWLCNLIESHIRFEERELYPFVESHLSPQQLTDIGERLNQYPVVCKEVWEDRFWSL